MSQVLVNHCMSVPHRDSLKTRHQTRSVCHWWWQTACRNWATKVWYSSIWELGLRVDGICYCDLLLSLTTVLPATRHGTLVFRRYSSISRSSVAMRLKPGRSCNDHFIANFLLSVPVRVVNIWRRHGKWVGVLEFFWLTVYTCYVCCSVHTCVFPPAGRIAVGNVFLARVPRQTYRSDVLGERDLTIHLQQGDVVSPVVADTDVARMYDHLFHVHRYLVRFELRPVVIAQHYFHMTRSRIVPAHHRRSTIYLGIT